MLLFSWFLDLLHLLVVCWPSLCYWIRVSQVYLTVAITWGLATNLDFLVPSKLTESYYPGVGLGVSIFKTYLRGAFELLFFKGVRSLLSLFLLNGSFSLQTAILFNSRAFPMLCIYYYCYICFSLHSSVCMLFICRLHTQFCIKTFTF